MADAIHVEHLHGLIPFRSCIRRFLHTLKPTVRHDAGAFRVSSLWFARDLDVLSLSFLARCTGFTFTTVAKLCEERKI